LNKIGSNQANDEKAIKALRKDGWKVITIWECRLKATKVERALSALLKKFPF
jgi:G:T-mismatch repair DNA endonuclease (very short patch repair protein)